MNWKYTDETSLVVARTTLSGSGISCLVSTEKVQKWIALGNTPDPYVPPAITTVPIVFEDFQDRFTTQEFDAVTDFVYETDTVTGKPKRKTLIQGMSKAIALNSIDLLGVKTIAFMGALVSGSVITEGRKDIILTP